MSNSDTLIVYHLFEKDQTYIDNFHHFLRFGYQPDFDYLVVIAGANNTALPEMRNIRYLLTDNHNNDYGGYCAAVQQTPNILQYETVFFINSSVRGPFLPGGDPRCWTDVFKQHFSDEVGLVGTSINILHDDTIFAERYEKSYQAAKPYSHVQTTAYALNRRCLEVLIDAGFYQPAAEMVKEDVITHYELRLSQLLIEKGWNIKCLLPEYNNIDYRLPHQDINPTSGYGDPSYPCGYFGRTFHPYEVMFIKTNRDMLREQYLERLAYSAHSARPAGANLLEQPGVASYVSKIEVAGKSKETVNFNETTLNPLQVMNFVRGLVTQHPEFAQTIVEIAQAGGGRSPR
ncbi:MAG: hypothetical protein RL194_534 [Pseudomonadota bacterium]